LAGDFYERMENTTRALDSFIKGKAFRRAVELSRRAFPDKVVWLEEQWGDYLVDMKQRDAAINHYIEAGANCYSKAIEAALDARMWQKAVQLVDDTVVDPNVAKPYYLRVARHYQQARQLEEAERFFVKAGSAQDAVDMYTRVNKWERAHKIATRFMTEAEVGLLYVNQAVDLERNGKLKEAERLYLTVNEADLAINMYKKCRKYDHMIRLVTTYVSLPCYFSHGLLYLCTQSIPPRHSVSAHSQHWHTRQMLCVSPLDGKPISDISPLY
jgi:intraflagellar transport protein 172